VIRVLESMGIGRHTLKGWKEGIPGFRDAYLEVKHYHSLVTRKNSFTITKANRRRKLNGYLKVMQRRVETGDINGIRAQTAAECGISIRTIERLCCTTDRYYDEGFARRREQILASVVARVEDEADTLATMGEEDLKHNMCRVKRGNFLISYLKLTSKRFEDKSRIRHEHSGAVEHSHTHKAPELVATLRTIADRFDTKELEAKPRLIEIKASHG